MFFTKKSFVALGLAGLIVGFILILSFGVYFGVTSFKKVEPTFYNAGVVSNGYECAYIGSSILAKQGSAVDAAIATLFCEGIAMPQSMGLGGGFLMTIYIRETKTAITLDAREVAPLSATEDMYGGNASLASKGGAAVAVPGELKGYWEAHQKYGKLDWADLVQPTIDLCKSGHLVTGYLARMLAEQKPQIINDPGLKEIYIDPMTNEPYAEGTYVKRPQLAKTLELIAKKGADTLYAGELTKSFVEDIKAKNGSITEEDLRNYKPLWQEPIKAQLPNKQTLYTVQLPGSGVILSFILNILSGFLDLRSIDSVTVWQRVVESFKYGYGKRTELGDPRFVEGVQSLVDQLTSKSYAGEVRSNISDTKTSNNHEDYGANVTLPEDHGTAHISVLAANGDAVSVTSTINQYFGAGFRSPSTGIILNDEMDDFSAPGFINKFGVPPSPSNFIVPGKRPMSSMCPSVVVDENGDAILVVGAAGGTKITTTTALVTLRYLWYGDSLVEAVNKSRLHHQLFPMQINFEHDFDWDVVVGLTEIGHKIHVDLPKDGFAALTALAKRNGFLEGSVDRRRAGSVSLIDS